MTDVAGWVDRLDEMAVEIADQTLRGTGMVQPPTVYVLLDGLDPPYVGYVRCRPFYRGSDAVRALGLVGSMLGAARVVVTWENADLWTALELPDAGEVQSGVAVVDADRDGHVLRWHPAVFRDGPVNAGGGWTAFPEWGRPVAYPRGSELPAPVGELLSAWRAPRVWSESGSWRRSRGWRSVGTCCAGLPGRSASVGAVVDAAAHRG